MQFNSLAWLFVVLLSPAVGQILPAIQLTPKSVAVASGELKLTISGSQFTQTLQVLWNGQPRPTQFVDAHTLKGTILSSDLAQPGLVNVSLINTNSGAPASESVLFLIYVPLRANDLIYDPRRLVVYVSVSKQDPNGPSVAIVQPDQGTVQRYIPLPSEPGVLAISGDASYLYVALKDRVRRIDLTGETGNLDIPLSVEQQSLGVVTSMLPLPPNGASVVVSVGSTGTGFFQTFAADGAQQRSGTTSCSCLAGTTDGSTIYGSTQQTLLVFSLGSGGFGPAFPKETQNFISGTPCPIFTAGLLYDGAGDIADPAIPKVLGRFGAWGILLPIPSINQAFFIGTDSTPSAAQNPVVRLMIFDNTSRQLLQSVGPLPVTMNLFTGRLINWGSNGLGFAEFQSSGGGPASWIHLFQVPSQ